MVCKYCNSLHVQKDGIRNGRQRYRCMECGKRFAGEPCQNTSESFVHFNVTLKKTERNKLTRDNYCVPQKEVSYRVKKINKGAKAFYEQQGREPLFCSIDNCVFPNEVYEDEEHYTDATVQTHYKNCMENFDLNMRYFESLDHDEFDTYLQKFVKKHKFIETRDLNELREISGIYILVLDQYNQVYIGLSRSSGGIKGRIMQHWSRRKEFDHLLNGSVETSILSIDSFGALDTTRIFYRKLKGYQNLDELEAKLVGEFKSEYRLNRVAGGLNSEDDATLRNLALLASMQTRELK